MYVSLIDYTMLSLRDCVQLVYFSVFCFFFCKDFGLFLTAAHYATVWLLYVSGRYDMAAQGEIPSEFLDRSGVCCSWEVEIVGTWMAGHLGWVGAGNSCWLFSSWLIDEEMYAKSQNVILILTAINCVIHQLHEAKSSWEASNLLSYSRNSIPLIESESSLMCSQEPDLNLSHMYSFHTPSKSL
jgi:hypothetical protein